MKQTETFIGHCSKFIDGQGWTVEIPADKIEEKGYKRKDRRIARSKTYAGVAKAMAQQWG